MKTVLLFLLALVASEAAASPPDASISATGAIYLTYDIGIEGFEGVLSGRFVPDASSLPNFPAVTTGESPGPVTYITIRRLTTKVLESLVGTDEAARLSHDRMRIVKVPVRVVLKHYKGVVECDARTYRASLVSVRPLGSPEVASRDNSPIGC
jgi:hypothetical protein